MSDSSDSEGCSGCDNDLGKDYKNCGDCENKLCKKCVRNKKGINLCEWLTGLPNKCTNCEKLLCGDCIRLCYNCANNGEYNIYCKQCARQEKIKKIKCPYHE